MRINNNFTVKKLFWPLVARENVEAIEGEGVTFRALFRIGEILERTSRRGT